MEKILTLENSIEKEKQNSASFEERIRLSESAHEDTKKELSEQLQAYEALKQKNAKIQERAALLESRIGAAVSLLQDDNANDTDV